MATININKREVAKINRNKRSNNSSSFASSSSLISTNGNTIDWADISPDLVTINRDLKVTGNITATKDVIAYVAGEVTSDVLNALSVSEPLEKTGTNISLNYNSEQFETNTNNELQLKATTNPYSTYIYTQNIPAAIWNVTHNLKRFPTVTVIDSANTTIEGNIKYLDNNSVIITFCAAFTGSAFFN